MLKDISKVQPTEDYRLRLRFEDGVEGEVDSADMIRNRPIPLLGSEQEPSRMVAGMIASNLPVEGDIHPLVGRERRSNNVRYRYAGQHRAFSAVGFVHGSPVRQTLGAIIGEFGVWQWLVERELQDSTEERLRPERFRSGPLTRIMTQDAAIPARVRR